MPIYYVCTSIYTYIYTYTGSAAISETHTALLIIPKGYLFDPITNGIISSAKACIDMLEMMNVLRIPSFFDNGPPVVNVSRILAAAP